MNLPSVACSKTPLVLLNIWNILHNETILRGKMTKKQDAREAFSLCGVFNLFVFPVSKLFSAAFFQQMKCVFGEDKSFL